MNKALVTPFLIFVTAFGFRAYALDSSSEIPEINRFSIYRIEPLRDGLIIGVTSLGSLYAYASSDRLIHPRCPCDVMEVNSIDRQVIGNQSDLLDHVSDYTVAAAVAFPVALDWFDVGWSKEFGEDMTVLAESLSVNGGLVTLAKYTTQRPLPRTYQNDPSLVYNPRGYRSFYSGHTSVALSAMSTAVMTHRYRHPEDRWPIVLTAAVGASVAYERIAAGRHFYTDVIVGAIVGTAIGVSVPYLHHRGDEANTTFAVTPQEDGAMVVWKIKI
jgi:membrane-associated phospholipid phosphatase